MLAKEAVEEFKILYKKRFGVGLNDAEASLRANHLVDFYRAVLSPEPNGELHGKGGAEQKSHHDPN